jgi:Flp pilus assembly protein TadD
LSRPARAAWPRSGEPAGPASDLYSSGLNQHLEAEANFRKAVEIAPRYADAMLGLGITQYKRNQWDAALASFQAAQALPPPNAYTSMWTAITLFQLNRLPEARQAAEQANAMKPGDPTIQQVLAQIRQRGG